MCAGDATNAEDRPKYRSPKRALARAFRLSRDRWKKKATQRRQELKALQVRLRDLEISRDLWKDKAVHLQRQVQDLLGLAQSPAQESSPPAAPPGPTAAAAETTPAGDQPALAPPVAPPLSPSAAATPTEGRLPKKATGARR